MEGNEGRETSEDGRRKGGKTVVIKIWRKILMKESEMEKRKWEEMKRVEREDRPLNTSDGREERELESRLMEEREMKGEIENVMIEEEREMRDNEGC